MTTGKIYAPWDPATVIKLNEYQRGGWLHPFTCGVSSRHGSLLATAGGWVCPTTTTTCDYRQRWAHRFMTEPRP